MLAFIAYTLHDHPIACFCFVDPCKLVDIMLALDNSGSITQLDPNNWDYMIDYSTNLATQVTLGETEYQVGALLFGNSGRIKIKLDQTRSNAELTDLIENLNFQAQRTNVVGGLQGTRVIGFNETNGARSNAYKVAIFLYDGEPTNPDFGTIDDVRAEAPKLKEAGVEVFITLSSIMLTTEKCPSTF